MTPGPLFLARYPGHDVVVDGASAIEVAALHGPLEATAVRDILAPWDLIAVRAVGGCEHRVHALGWREAEANTRITSALVTVDPRGSLIFTPSGAPYWLGGGGVNAFLLDHPEHALRAWGFADAR